MRGRNMKKRRARAFPAVSIATALAVGLLGAGRLRASATDGRFTSATDGLGGVKDNVTGLTWQQPDSGTTYTWSVALTHCASPWRAPTIGELYSLVDVRGMPAIDPVFSGTSSNGYWTSTTLAGSGNANAWLVNFFTGTIYNESVTNGNRIRCVR
jgi:Protein of unknown function (DUF1566)